MDSVLFVLFNLVGLVVGADVGEFVGSEVGVPVGVPVGIPVGALVGTCDRDGDGEGAKDGLGLTVFLPCFCLLTAFSVLGALDPFGAFGDLLALLLFILISAEEADALSAALSPTTSSAAAGTGSSEIPKTSAASSFKTFNSRDSLGTLLEALAAPPRRTIPMNGMIWIFII